MKFAIFGFLIFGLAALSSCFTKDEQKAMAKTLLNECKKEEGGSDADFEVLEGMNYPTTKEGMCMVACTHEKIGIIKDGVFKRENFLLFLKMATDGHEENESYMKLGEDLADLCGGIGGERCEQAIEFDKCMEKEVKARGIKLPFI